MQPPRIGSEGDAASIAIGVSRQRAAAARPNPTPTGRAHHVGGRLVRVAACMYTRYRVTQTDARDDEAVSYGVEATRSMPSLVAVPPSPSFPPSPMLWVVSQLTAGLL